MTAKQFYTEYWKPILLTIVPTIIIVSASTFVSVKVALAVQNEKIGTNCNNIKKIEFHNQLYDNSVLRLQRDCAYIKGVLGLHDLAANE